LKQARQPTTNTPSNPVIQSITNIGKPITRMKKNVTQIYFRILTGNKIKENSAQTVAHIFLKASQLFDPSAEMLTCPAIDKP
jgi:hypothetical protein